MTCEEESFIDLSSSCLCSKENFDRMYCSLRFLISMDILDVISVFLQVNKTKIIIAHRSVTLFTRNYIRQI
jgi:hypothetical protein